MVNDTEKILSAFSQMYFFKELVQDQLQFTEDGSTEKEVAGLLLNLGDIVVAVQLKARNESGKTEDLEKEIKCNEKAILLACDLKESGNKNKMWIAKDALKELETLVKADGRGRLISSNSKMGRE